MSEIYKGRAPESDYGPLMAMLDDVFFSDEPCDFITILPKLYKEKYNPCHNNFIVKENGVIKGAVGMYESECVAAGKRINVAGIGNVAVAKNCRGEGHMIECMNMAMKAAVEGGADISILGGQRQRYGYFGFEPAGQMYCFHISKTNLRHLLGKDTQSGWTAREITGADSDSNVIDKIIVLNSSQPFYPIRAKDSYVDIMRSWRNKLYAAFEGEEFKGYFAAGSNGSISEFIPKENGDFLKLVLCCFEVTGEKGCDIRVPFFSRPLADCFVRACESYFIDCPLMISILNYKNIIEGFLGVKARSDKLADGSVTLLIHGRIGDENLEITVKNNAVSVERTAKKPDIELNHHEAVRFVCAPFSNERANAEPFVQQWFPVPFSYYSCDDV